MSKQETSELTSFNGASATKLLDFLAFMESESVVREMLALPNMPLFIVKKLQGSKVSHHVDARGPFGLTNIFMQDYLTTSQTSIDAARLIKGQLVGILPNLVVVPVYDIAAILNWYEKFGPEVSSWEELYDKYYGPYDGKPLSKAQVRRVQEYFQSYPAESSFWLATI